MPATAASAARAATAPPEPPATAQPHPPNSVTLVVFAPASEPLPLDDDEDDDEEEDVEERQTLSDLHGAPPAHAPSQALSTTSVMAASGGPHPPAHDMLPTQNQASAQTAPSPPQSVGERQCSGRQ